MTETLEEKRTIYENIRLKLPTLPKHDTWIASYRMYDRLLELGVHKLLGEHKLKIVWSPEFSEGDDKVGLSFKGQIIAGAKLDGIFGGQ